MKIKKIPRLRGKMRGLQTKEVQRRFKNGKKKISVFRKGNFGINEVFYIRNSFYGSSKVHHSQEEILISVA
jgi:hypothetical protein